MKSRYKYHDGINLFVRGRICKDDAERQEKTAREILRRLEDQPGLILADEVGMGKTFVALAVAVSVHLYDKRRRPVVIMVPPSIKDKWPRDLSFFLEKCLTKDVRRSITWAKADNAVEFLKLLDDPIERRKSIIFLTHGALWRGLDDGWVKLALIWRALYRRKNTRKIRLALYRCLGSLLWLKWVEIRNPNIWEILLDHKPDKWLKILKEQGINPGGYRNNDDDDDPVPRSAIRALSEIDADTLYYALYNIPFRRSGSYKYRMVEARRLLNNQVKEVWRSCITKLAIRLPLLILDEAHHLKNEKTQLASLFRTEDARADMEEIKGPLAGVFERMLFLTATPFQLGHYELCNVLKRFEGINWDKPKAPPYGREIFLRKIEELRESLDAAQTAALRLESAWGVLKTDDLKIGERTFTNIEEWWREVLNTDNVSSALQNVKTRFRQTFEAMRMAEKLLRPWVIRHLRKKMLPENFGQIERRKVFKGSEILLEKQEATSEGLVVNGEALVPFLLACRIVACSPNSRPVFAEGLASSYEAFLYTRRQCQRSVRGKNAAEPTDIDDEPVELYVSLDQTSLWYLEKIEQFLPRRDLKSSLSHPKIRATVERVIELWKKREKVLVFCHYIATGKVLRQHISKAIENELKKEGAALLGLHPGEVFSELERIGKRFFDMDSPLRRACDEKVRSIIKKYKPLRAHEEDLIDVVRRYIRTPSFLIRYMPLKTNRFTKESIIESFSKPDDSGMTLERLVDMFFKFLVKHCGEQERQDYLNALESVKPGAYMTVEVEKEYWEEEEKRERTEKSMANVRLVNGETKSDVRKNLMLAFNTPFFPEILIASSVMAEGVDLHLNCRYVIHHDLCWNPSTLEQRTGRIDRIGAKAERCGKSIYVYLPYISETQDEKMFRVVMDRERWFRVVMGEKLNMDVKTTDKIAERIPLPESLAHEVAFDLTVKNAE